MVSHDEAHPIEQAGLIEEGTVVLDIGGDIGALIVHTDASMGGVEIEISPNDEHGEDVFQKEHPHLPEQDAEHTHEHTHEGGDGHSHTHAHTPGTTHVAVLGRRSREGVQWAAIYPGLRAGEYTLLNQDGTPAHVVTIVGGEVVELRWS